MPQLKAPTTYEQQLDILRSRNVQARNSEKCLSVLESVNYYRFVAYFLPFKQPDGNYRDGTNFQTVYRIYEFDRKLRGILFSALEEVEIFIRSKLAYFHAHKYGAEGYLNPENFSKLHKAEKFRENLDREISSNKHSAFVMHHQRQYGGHFPIWVIVELFTFGMLSRFYGDLTTADQKKIARELYGTIPKNMNSWLRCCTDLRNICAHYGRLYYRVFSATPAGVNANEPGTNRLWGATLALKSLYPNSRKWNTEILPQLAALIEEYQDDIQLAHIGFPDNWEEALTFRELLEV